MHSIQKLVVEDAIIAQLPHTGMYQVQMYIDPSIRFGIEIP